MPKAPDADVEIGFLTGSPSLYGVEAWTRAARGWQAARSLRLAWFGGIMRNVAVTEGDKVEAERVFGCSVNTWGVNDLVAVVDAVPDADVDALAKNYDDSYEVVP